MTDGAQGQEGQGSDLREFFVRLSEPVNFRRTLLGSSKSILNMLKVMYKFEELREKKKVGLATLKKEMEEIRLLVQKLEDRMPVYNKEDIKKYFPKLDLEKKELKKVRTPDAKQKEDFTQEVIKEADSEMDELTKALANVEQRMSSLPPEQPSYTQPPAGSKADDVDDLGKALNDLKKKLSNF